MSRRHFHDHRSAYAYIKTNSFFYLFHATLPTQVNLITLHVNVNPRDYNIIFLLYLFFNTFKL